VDEDTSAAKLELPLTVPPPPPPGVGGKGNCPPSVIFLTAPHLSII
jgi:hypothetical protein